MAETVVYTPENNGGSIPAWMAMQNNGLFGNNAWGGGILGFLLGLWFGNGNGFGGFGGGNNASANAQREMLNTAILSQGEASRTATQNLANMLGQDFNLINSNIQTIQSALSTFAMQQAVSVPQIVNAIQSGDASLASQFAQCCCENKLLVTSQGYENQLRTVEQTNQLGNAINGVQQAVAAKAAADQLSTCQQTYALTDVMSRNYLALDNKIDALESSRKDREITALTAKVAQLESQNFTTGVIGSAIAPVNAALNSLAKEVDDIKCKQPSTATVQWPNLQAVNVTPYVSGGYYQGGFNGVYGYPGIGGFGGGLNF